MFLIIVGTLFVAFLFIGGLIVLATATATIIKDWPNLKGYFERKNDIRLEKIRLDNELEKEKLRFEAEKDARSWEIINRSKIFNDLELDGERLTSSE